jgi:ATP-binding cassette subfamily B protein
LIVAHRYSMVREVDQVVVLDAGRVVESGTPRDLLAAGGWFARLAAGTAEAEPRNEATRDEEEDAPG